jgi:hypothetical protein
MMDFRAVQHVALYSAAYCLCCGAVVQFPSGLTKEDLKTWRGYLTNMYAHWRECADSGVLDCCTYCGHALQLALV